MEAIERRSGFYKRIVIHSTIFASLFLAQNVPLLVSAFQPKSAPAVPFFQKFLREKCIITPSHRKMSFARRSTRLNVTSQATYIPPLSKQQRQRLRKWDRMILDLTAFREEKGHSLVTANDVKENEKWAELYLWTRSVRRNYVHQVLETRPRRTASSSMNTKRHSLPREKIRQLQRLEFCWDVQTLAWERRYNELVRFYREHGHSRVPADYPNGLGIFVRNCRKEYRRLENGEPSTLTVERLNKLFAVEFVWSRSREEAWEHRYQQLQQFHQKHGHSNVPEHFPENPALGRWCINQRTYYRRLYRGEMSSLTEERIQLLEDLGFVWSYPQYKFDNMLERLSQYYAEHGHIRVATSDSKNQDLRFWVTIQRYYYHLRKRDLESGGESTSPLTEDRIEAIESTIPDFNWRARGVGNGGPSSQDWEKLFKEMRKKGIRPGMPEKRHWFDGVNPFSGDVKNIWTDEDLMALWNEDSDDDDDDDDWTDGS